MTTNPDDPSPTAAERGSALRIENASTTDADQDLQAADNDAPPDERPPERKKIELTPALVISILALTVSGLGFYFQNIRINEQLHAAFAHHRFNEKGLIAFDAVLSNSGNRTVAVTDLSVVVHREGRRDPPEHFPIPRDTVVLRPGDFFVQPICIALLDFELMRVGEKPAEVKVVIGIVTSAGRRYEGIVHTLTGVRVPSRKVTETDGGVHDGPNLYSYRVRRATVPVISSGGPQAIEHEELVEGPTPLFSDFASSHAKAVERGRQRAGCSAYPAGG